MMFVAIDHFFGRRSCRRSRKQDIYSLTPYSGKKRDNGNLAYYCVVDTFYRFMDDENLSRLILFYGTRV